MDKQKQVLFPAVQKLEEMYLLEKSRKRAGDQIEFIIDHNLQYLKERFLTFETQNKISGVEYNKKLFEYCQLVENMILFEPDVKKKLSGKMYKILTGSTDLLKNYCLGVQQLTTYKKERKKIIKEHAEAKKKAIDENLQREYTDFDNANNTCPLCRDNFRSKKKLKKHKEDEHSI